MGRLLRHIPPNALVEVTCRTIQGRLLLRPDPELNRRVLGVLGRAQRNEGLPIHAMVFASNHYHLLASPEEPLQLVRFMNQAQSSLAREAGRFYDWRERFWSRRYRHIVVAHEVDAQLDRLRYILSHGVKEGLVARCRDWPGVSCVRALLEGEALEGVWYDRTAFYEANRRKGGAVLEDFAHREVVKLTPLPCWRGLTADEIREHVVELVEAIERRHHALRLATGSGVAGVRAVRRRDPHDRPARLKRSPAPTFHARSREAWLELREGYQRFAEEFRVAADLLRRGRRAWRFPPGSFPPNLPYVPLLAPG